ncbi:phage tail protein [Lactobacillus sp. UMNPBX5]|nr:phage tail protein [Lactobacillus sp. UMNPBX5]
MSEVIASKRIVITAEDRVTSVIAKTTQAFNQLEQHLQQLGMKFNNGATEQSSYRSALTQTKSTVGEADEAIKKLNHNIGELKGTHTVDVKVDTKQTNENIKQLKNTADEATKSGHSMTKSFVFGSLVSSGIQSATNSLIGFAKQGFQAAVAGQQVVARWSALGMTKGQIKEVGAAVADLKENTNMSGAAVGNLVTRFYGLTGSAKEAITLSKGVGSITDSLHLSNAASDAFANGLARIESAGKVTTQSLGRLEKQAPGLTAALQKASGMSKKSFDDLLASGKMTTSQFNDILEKASVDYAKNAKSWEKTSEGAIHHMKTEWSDSWKTMMAPLAQSSSQGLGALSKALDKLQPQFKEVGEAIADLATKFAKWLTPKHAEDLGKIVTAFGRMAIVLGKGVWKAAMAPFELIGRVIQLLSGKHGDALDAIADGLDRISKNKIAMSVLEGIGMVLMTQFAYGKLFKIADGLGLVSKGILSIGRMKFTGHIFRDIFNGAESLKRIKINPAQWFKGGTSWAKNLFKPLPSEALKTGESAGGNFITRFAAKTNASKFAQVGRSLGGRILSGVGLAVEAYDLVKDIHGAFTSHNGTTRSRDTGKAVGAGIGAGIGFFFGGPAGAALGGMIGRVIGGKIGPAVGKFGNSIGKVLTDIFEKHDWNKVWSDIGKGWQSFWKGMGNWWDQTIGKKGSHQSSSKDPSQKEIKSLGGNHYSKQDIANIRQMNSAVRAYTRSLRRLKQVVKKDDPTKQLRSMSKEFKSINPAVEKSAKYWRSLAKPLEMSAKAFKVVNKALNSFKGKNNPLDRLDKSVTSLTKTIKREQFGKLLAKQMQIADKSMSGKHSFVGQFESMTKRVISQLRRFRKTFDSDWRNTWTRLDRYPSRGLSRTASIISNRLDSVLSREHSFSSRFTSSWKKWVDDVVSAMRSGFDKLPGIARKAMQGIVSRLNSGISAINNVISDFGGDKRLGTIHYAKGTLFHPGGKAVLNDGSTASKQELVWEPSRGFSLPQGQNTVHDLERGAMVLDAPHTDSILNRMGIPHYAGGTISEDEQDKIAEEFIDNPIKASRDLVLRFTNWNSSVPVVADLGKATAIGFSRGIANVLKDLLGIIKEPINGDWTPVIKSAFRVLHIHPAGWMISKFLRQIQTESGGRETAIGGTDGLPDGRATGLLQFKPGTFAHWARAPYDHIMKGFDQIVTAIRVLMAGGEGGWSNFGMGHGWATGGEITSQQFGWVGDNAQHHEFVINPYNSNALPLMAKAWTVMSNNHPEWASQSDGTFASEMIGLMKATIASINSLDLQPVAFVDDASRAINKHNAKQISMMRGGR